MKITVKVHPKSKKQQIKQTSADQLELWVSQPPVDNQANLAVIENLARYFGVSKAAVILKSGARAKIKVFEIFGVEELPKPRDLFSKAK